MTDRPGDIPVRVTLGLDPHHEERTIAVMEAPLAAERVMMLPRLVTVRTTLRRLLPCSAEDIDRRLVARMRHHVVRLEDRNGAAVEIVASDHDVMAKPGLAHRFVLELQP